MTLEAIKEAIGDLPSSEKTSLATWICLLDAELWDKQIEADFGAGGRGLRLLDEWDADIHSGDSMPLDQFLATRQGRRR